MNRSKQLLSLIKISRPGTWFLHQGIVALGMVYGRAVICPRSLAVLAMLGFPYSFWLYSWNDFYDRDSDRVNPRKDSWLQGGIVHPEIESLVRITAFSSALIPIITGWLLRFQTSTATLLLIGYFLAWAYSAPPIRLKERLLLEGYCTAASLWTLFAVGFSLGSPLTKIPLELYFCLPTAVGIHIYYTVVDLESDQQAGHCTVAVRLGRRFALFLSSFYAALSVCAIPFVHYAKAVEVMLIINFLFFSLSWLFADAIPSTKGYCRTLVLLNGLCLIAIPFW